MHRTTDTRKRTSSPMPNNAPGKGLNAKTGGIKHKWWLVGGLGIGVAGYVYYARQTAAAATTPVTDTTTPTDSYDPYAGYDTGYGTASGGAYGAAYTDPAATKAAQDSADALGSIADAFNVPVDTNQDWMHHAMKALED